MPQKTASSLAKLLGFEALIIAALTISGYLVAYCFEWGYLSFFSIPADFIEIDLPSVLFALTSIAILVLLAFILSEMAFVHGFFQKKTFSHYFFKTSILMLILYVLFLVFLWDALDWQEAIIVFAMAPVFSIFLAWQQVRANRKKSAPRTSPLTEQSLLMMAEKHGLAAPITSFVMLILFCVIAFMVGNTAATAKSFFPIIKHAEGELLLVRLYESDMLLMPIFSRDNSKTTLSHRVVLSDKESLSPADFRFEKIRQLCIGVTYSPRTPFQHLSQYLRRIDPSCAQHDEQ